VKNNPNNPRRKSPFTIPLYGPPFITIRTPPPLR
jgi:hypothetical protein